MSDLSDSVAKEIVAYLDGSLDAAQVKELGARLQQDRSLRREVAQLLLQQVQLAEIGQEDKVTGDLPVTCPRILFQAGCGDFGGCASSVSVQGGQRLVELPLYWQT